MRITIVLVDGKRVPANLPYHGAPHALAEIRCPHGCDVSPISIAGTGITHHNHDTYFAPAVALCCRKSIGTIETKVDTLFGLDEDAAVLSGRCRVY